eukprot:TRINITY_DN374061_c0_g1_i1.p1 TRINITY_DN374061_c0_g1~~TRINITY_DN374061_c0_g1_i1.p1  ORF type:complete len:395 (-),score=107.58 TRINITY_DN374061_c0_g1_i1:150-1334(-)
MEIHSAPEQLNARLGSYNDLEFPHMMISLSSMLVPHILTKELPIMAPGNLVSVQLSDFIRCRKSLALSQKSFTEYSNLMENPMCVVTKQAGIYSTPNNDNSSFGLFSKNGRQKIKVDEFPNLIAESDPYFFALPSDEVPPSSTSLKRVQLGLKRTEEWTARVFSKCKESAGFVPIEGGSSMLLRKEAAEKAANIDCIGYQIKGIYLDETEEERMAVLNEVIPRLPADKIKFVSGCMSAMDILKLAAAGVDLFDNGMPLLLTNNDLAAVFPITPCEIPEGVTRPTQVQLRDARFNEDSSPILEGCECYACKNHTRAYINHLLIAHEMLGKTLMQTHNLHHFLLFIKKIKATLKDGTFEEYYKSFENWWNEAHKIISKEDAMKSSIRTETLEKMEL